MLSDSHPQMQTLINLFRTDKLLIIHIELYLKKKRSHSKDQRLRHFIYFGSSTVRTGLV